jgi:hypothetical protein
MVHSRSELIRLFLERLESEEVPSNLPVGSDILTNPAVNPTSRVLVRELNERLVLTLGVARSASQDKVIGGVFATMRSASDMVHAQFGRSRRLEVTLAINASHSVPEIDGEPQRLPNLVPLDVPVFDSSLLCHLPAPCVFVSRVTLDKGKIYARSVRSKLFFPGLFHFYSSHGIRMILTRLD